MAFAIEEILKKAREAGASDVHIIVGTQPRMRVNTRLLTFPGSKVLPADTMEMAIHVLNEKQRQYLDEYGEVMISFETADDGRCRVSAYRQRGQIAMSFRLIKEELPLPAALGIPESVISLCQKRKGLVLVSGPSGSGRTTTLASLLDTINSSREVHILTLESPIEYRHKHKMAVVSQREIGTDAAGYAQALRAALYEDPDVIFIGAPDGEEATKAAIEAAETGHLVFAVRNETGAAQTIERIVDECETSKQPQLRARLSNVLTAVISQQLLQTEDEAGRAAAFEVYHNYPAVKKFIREGKTHQLEGIMQANKKLGMTTMEDAVAKLYEEHRISRETALQFALDWK